MINTQLLKFFAKLQMDSEPGIRTNTTICLANIAVYLSDAVCIIIILNFYNLTFLYNYNNIINYYVYFYKF